VLKELVPCSDVYFSVVESLLDKISAAGAAPHRADHRRILDELESTLERCSASGAQFATTDLVHALDTLVMHEATIRLRSSQNPSSRF
jgi:hemerythrin